MSKKDDLESALAEQKQDIAAIGKRVEQVRAEANAKLDGLMRDLQAIEAAYAIALKEYTAAPVDVGALTSEQSQLAASITDFNTKIAAQEKQVEKAAAEAREVHDEKKRKMNYRAEMNKLRELRAQAQAQIKRAAEIETLLADA